MSSSSSVRDIKCTAQTGEVGAVRETNQCKARCPNGDRCTNQKTLKNKVIEGETTSIEQQAFQCTRLQLCDMHCDEFAKQWQSKQGKQKAFVSSFLNYADGPPFSDVFWQFVRVTIAIFLLIEKFNADTMSRMGETNFFDRFKKVIGILRNSAEQLSLDTVMKTASQCQAFTSSGRNCRNKSALGARFCTYHNTN